MCKVAFASKIITEVLVSDEAEEVCFMFVVSKCLMGTGSIFCIFVFNACLIPDVVSL